jgi:plastocyanin
VKEKDMHAAIVARWGATVPFGVVLLVLLGASGCGNKEEKGFTAHCGNKSVKVDIGVPPHKPATPEAVYVCEGDIVTWDPAGAVETFEVEFKKEYPFTGNTKKFHKGDPKSPKTKHQEPGLTVYEYKITVNGVPYDPQVVGGGN